MKAIEKLAQKTVVVCHKKTKGNVRWSADGTLHGNSTQCRRSFPTKVSGVSTRPVHTVSQSDTRKWLSRQFV
jgi:hypothetical protein